MARQSLIRRISLLVAATASGLSALQPGCITSAAALLGETDENGPSPNEIQESKANTPPVAVAGEDEVADAGSVVVLNGAASSDPDRQKLSYIWQQVDGEPTVEIEGQFSSFMRFDAPADITTETTLTFRLLVIDGFAFAADEVTVTVQPVP